MRHVYINIGLPLCLYRLLRPIKRCLIGSHNEISPNLAGERDVEWSWICSQIFSGPGEALDFGTGSSYLGLMAAQRGFNVTAIDLEPVNWLYIHPKLRFLQEDILKVSLPSEQFDLVINCSTIEHVGLAGRYGVTENRVNGDLEVMIKLRKSMKPSGVMLLTIPIGQDAVFAPLHRIYGRQRLALLLNGYIVEKEEFWVKDRQNRWIQCDREIAFNFQAQAGSWDPLKNAYALGCFVLQRPKRDKEQ